MSLYSKRRRPPRQARRFLAPGVTAAGGSVAVAAGTSTAIALAGSFGVAAASGTSTATAVGAPIAAGVAAAAGTSTAIAASSNIFPLTVQSGRYLKQSDGTPFLICGDSTWSIGVNPPLANVDAYLNTMTGQGFNTLLMNAIEHHYTVTKAPKERSGLLPFTQRLDASSYTGSPNGTPSASGTQGQFGADPYGNIGTQSPDWTFINNSYWQAIETVLTACLTHNVLVLVWPGYLGFHGNQEGWLSEMVVLDGITGAGGFTGQSFANPAKSKLWNYGAWLAARWKSYPNIVWVMGGDFGSGGQSLNTAQAAAVSNLMDGLKSVAGQGSLLYTAHWDRPCISDDTALAAGAFDLNFCYGDDASAEITRRGYASSPAKPAFFGEGFYEDGLFGGSTPYRRYLWWGFLGGCAGGFYGHEQLWRFDDGTPGTDYTTLLATTARLDAQRQFAFFKTKPWHRLKPNGLGGIGTLITAGGGTASPQSTDYVAAACTPEGDLLLAYVPPAHTGSVTVDMTKMSATAQARWFDPTNATFTSIGAFSNTGTHAFTTPGNNSAGAADWLLVLETITAAAAGTSIATAVGAPIAAGTAVSAGTGAAAAVGNALVAGAAATAGGSTATAVGVAAAAGIAAAAGTSTANAIPVVTAATAGTSSAAAVGAPLASGVAASAGTSTAVAIASGAGVASAAGTSTAVAIGSSIAAAVASAAGTSSAAATSGPVGPFAEIVSPTPGVAPGAPGGFPGDWQVARYTPVVAKVNLMKLTIVYAGSAAVHDVYDGNFLGEFAGSQSTKTAIPEGFIISFRPVNGWPNKSGQVSFTLTLDAVAP